MKKLAIVLSFVLFIASAALAADGAALYKSGCAGCHGMDGSKPTGNTTPLKDLDAATILSLLQGYKAGTQGGAHKEVMQRVVKEHSDEDLKAVADYAGTLGEGAKK